MPRVLVIGSLVTLIATAACGGGGSDDRAGARPSRSGASPSAADGINGMYAATFVIVSSTFKGDKVGAATKQSFEFAYLCAEDDCSSVYQRNTTPGARTRLFKVTGATWSWDMAKEAPCAAPAKGNSVTTQTWTWTRAGDGTMVGTRFDKQTGCKLDGVRRSSYTAGARTGDLPYVTHAEAAPLKKIMSDYDGAMKPLYASFPVCNKDFYGAKTALGGACLARDFATWVPLLTALESALAKEPIMTPRGACMKAIDVFRDAATSPLNKLRTAVMAGVTALDAAAAANDYADAGKKVTAALDSQGAFQDAFFDLALQCIAPDDLTGLGADGVLATDVESLIKAQPTS